MPNFGAGASQGDNLSGNTSSKRLKTEAGNLGRQQPGEVERMHGSRNDGDVNDALNHRGCCRTLWSWHVERRVSLAQYSTISCVGFVKGAAGYKFYLGHRRRVWLIGSGTQGRSRPGKSSRMGMNSSYSRQGCSPRSRFHPFWSRSKVVRG